MERAQVRGPARLRGAGAPIRAAGIPRRLPRLPRCRRGARRRPGGLRPRLARAAALPSRRRAAAVADADRGQRGPQPATWLHASRRASPCALHRTAPRTVRPHRPRRRSWPASGVRSCWPRWTALREEDRLVLALRWFAELGEAEMAAALRVPRGTVKSRLSRALERLRERRCGRLEPMTDRHLGTDDGAAGGPGRPWRSAIEWPPTPPLADRGRRRHPCRAGARRPGVAARCVAGWSLASVAALLLAGVAAAIGFALGGLRIISGGPPPGSPLPARWWRSAASGARDGPGRRDAVAGRAACAGPAEPWATPDHVYFDDADRCRRR